MRKVRVPFEDGVLFEISSSDLKNIELKIFHTDQKFSLKANMESLLDLLDRLRFAVESVISEL